MNSRRASFLTITVSIILYDIAVGLFALTPLLPEPNPIWPVEWVIAALAVCSGILLTGLALDRYAPITRWGFLMGGAAGVTTMLAFVIAEIAAGTEFRIVIGGFLFTGIFTGYAGHLLFGGENDQRGK